VSDIDMIGIGIHAAGALELVGLNKDLETARASAIRRVCPL